VVPSPALVFPGEDGGHWARGEWPQLCERTLIPEAKAIDLVLDHPIELRHTFCSLLLMEGVEPREVAAQGGIPEELFVDIYFMAIVHGGRFGETVADAEVQRARQRVAA
jgi:hypothetical protein